MATGKINILMPLAGREARMDGIRNGTAPKDFFYGCLALADHGFPVDYVNLRQDPAGMYNMTRLKWERLRNRFTNFGLTRQRIVAAVPQIASGDMVMSFTDSGSLSMGFYRDLLPQPLVLAGGFHGLCDMDREVHPAAQDWARRCIQRGLSGLDHCFFFGEEDMAEAVRRFDLDPENCSAFPFGVDLDFWRPGTEADRETDGGVFAVGSDPKRDYELLIKAAGTDVSLRILTRLALPSLVDHPNIDHVSGSLHGSAVTDEVLRDAYWRSSIVAVPVRQGLQPSGYSVSLQAMACGRPVIVSDIKGLWDRDKFRHGENCWLVPPGDHEAFRQALLTLQHDAGLRKSMGAAARETAMNHFGLERMNLAAIALAERLQGQSGNGM